MATEAEIAVFYSLELVNSQIVSKIKDPQWGMFIEPDLDLANYTDPNLKYGFDAEDNSKSDLSQVTVTDPVLIQIISKIVLQKNTITTADQCTAQYYLDLYNVLKLQAHEFQKIVEVGPHLGDLSLLFAGSLDSTEATLDLVDIDVKRLRYAYERVRRAFPAAVTKVRLFFGDLPTYIDKVLKKSDQKTVVHYKGSYAFNDVIRDIGSLSYVKQKILSVIVHNTNLRSTDISEFAFADVALFSIFGEQIKYLHLGEILKQDEMQDNAAKKLYYLANYFEGLFIPLLHNEFHYPHSNECLDNFLYSK